MTLAIARKELAKRLAAVGGLRVYLTPPDTSPELPAAIIQPGQPLVEYDRTLAGSNTAYNFTVLLLTRSGDDFQAWEELAGYLAPTGAGSLKAAVDTGANSDSGVDWLRLVRVGEGGPIVYHRVSYWGAACQVQAHVSG